MERTRPASRWTLPVTTRFTPNAFRASPALATSRPRTSLVGTTQSFPSKRSICVSVLARTSVRPALNASAPASEPATENGSTAILFSSGTGPMPSHPSADVRTPSNDAGTRSPMSMSAATTSARRFDGAGGLDAGGRGPAAPSTRCASASSTSSAVWNRSSGSFSRHRSTTPTRPAGTPGRSSLNDGGGSWTTA